MSTTPPPIYVNASLRIRGSAVAVPTCRSPIGPRETITNHDLVEILGDGLSDRKREALDRMIAASGTLTRHWSHWVGSPPSNREPSVVDLAADAVTKALRDAAMTIEDIDLLIFALSTSPLANLPSASPLGERLGYRGPSFDLKAGCAGALYALHVASMCLASGYRRVVVVGSDTMSKYVDREALMGFLNVGDAAGALVLERSHTQNFVSAICGEYSSWGSAGVFAGLPPVAGDAPFVYRGTPTKTRSEVSSRYRDSLLEILTHEGMGLSQLARWIPHQVSQPLLEEVHRELGSEAPPMVLNLDRYGNTGAAALLIALHEQRASDLGGWNALSALGGGMRWASALWQNPC